jgi:hypothetical protein
MKKQLKQLVRVVTALALVGILILPTIASAQNYEEISPLSQPELVKIVPNDGAEFLRDEPVYIYAAAKDIDGDLLSLTVYARNITNEFEPGQPELVKEVTGEEEIRPTPKYFLELECSRTFDTGSKWELTFTATDWAGNVTEEKRVITIDGYSIFD